MIVFQTVHRSSELEFDFPLVPLSLEDPETGEIIRLQPGEIKEHYQQQVATYNREIEMKMSQYKVDFTLVDTAKDVGYALIPFLVKRRKMSR